MAKPAPSPNSTFISQSDAAKDIDVSKVTLWRLINLGLYPEPVAIPGSIRKPIVRKEHEAYKAAADGRAQQFGEGRINGPPRPFRGTTVQHAMRFSSAAMI